MIAFFFNTRRAGSSFAVLSSNNNNTLFNLPFPALVDKNIFRMIWIRVGRREHWDTLVVESVEEAGRSRLRWSCLWLDYQK